MSKRCTSANNDSEVDDIVVNHRHTPERSSNVIYKYRPQAPGNGRRHELLRKVAARITESLGKLRSTRSEIWFGCGYPKSGTVWLCQLMSSVLDLPYPQHYLLPIAMPSVIHTHCNYSRRIPRTIYIVRDGRDVMVSFYHHRMRALDGHRNPQHAAQLGARLRKNFGANFDPANIRQNLARFIELEFTGALGRFPSWSDHVRQWSSAENKRIAIVRYEDLLSNGRATLGKAFEHLLNMPFDPWIIDTAFRRFDFERGSGRTPGEEDKNSFLRKGVANDWKNHFTADSAAVFAKYAGATLFELGYETDESWIKNFED